MRDNGRMRILNACSNDDAYPVVDERNLYYTQMTPAQVNAYKRTQEAEKFQANQKRQSKINSMRREVQLQQQLDLHSAKKTKQLNKSLSEGRRAQDELYLQAYMQGPSTYARAVAGWNKGYAAQLGTADFDVQAAVPAQEFGNHMNGRYVHKKDFPMISDVKADFGGVIQDESGSADFGATKYFNVGHEGSAMSNLSRLRSRRRR